MRIILMRALEWEMYVYLDHKSQLISRVIHQSWFLSILPYTVLFYLYFSPSLSLPPSLSISIHLKLLSKESIILKKKTNMSYFSSLKSSRKREEEKNYWRHSVSEYFLFSFSSIFSYCILVLYSSIQLYSTLHTLHGKPKVKIKEGTFQNVCMYIVRRL